MRIYVTADCHIPLRCITKAEPVHISITEKPRPEADRPSHLNVSHHYVPLCDLVKLSPMTV